MKSKLIDHTFKLLFGFIMLVCMSHAHAQTKPAMKAMAAPGDSVTLKITRTPSTMVAGQAFNVRWESTNAYNVSYSCSSSSGGFTGSATMAQVNGSSNGTADFSWIGHDSLCFWTAEGDGDVVTVSETMRTVAPPNNAEFQSQNVPTQMVAGQTYPVTIVFRNNSLAWWSESGAYRLGTQNPENNLTWGLNRKVSETVAPGASKSFTFNVVAPSSPGSYNFQWRMLQEGVEWFGDYTPNIVVNVTPPNPAILNLSIIAPSAPPNTSTSATVAVGQSFTLRWNLSGVTGQQLTCTDGFTNHVTEAIALQGEKTYTTSTAWAVGRPILCTVFASENGVSKSSPSVSITVPTPTPAPTLSVVRSMPIKAGQSFTTTWTTTNANSLSYSCTSSGGFNGSENVAVNGSKNRVAQIAWAGSTSSCKWVAVGPGGVTEFVDSFYVTPPDPAVLNLSIIAPSTPPNTSTSATVAVGQSFTLRWNLSGVTDPSLTCTDGFTSHVIEAISLQGEKTYTTSAAWAVGRPILCSVFARENGTGVTSPSVSITVPTPIPAPTISIVRSTPIKAGQSFTTNWTTTNANSLSYSCTSSGGFNGSANVTTNGSENRVAQLAWAGSTTSCRWVAVGSGGVTEFVDSFYVTPPDPAVLNLSIIAPSTPPNTSTSATVAVGQSFTLRWNLSGVTDPSLTCTDGFTSHVIEVISLQGEKTYTTSTAWAVGRPVLCSVFATENGTRVTSTSVSITVPLPPAVLNLSIIAPSTPPNTSTSATVQIGQSFTLNWDLSGVTNQYLVCHDGFTNLVIEDVSLQGQGTYTTSAAWAQGRTILCWISAKENGVSKSSPTISITVPAPPAAVMNLALTAPTTGVSATVQIGQSFTLGWNLSGVTDPLLVCTDGFTSHVMEGIGLQGEKTYTTTAAWAVGRPIKCNVFATENGTRITSKSVSIVVPSMLPTISVVRSLPITAGESFTTTWTTTNATSLSYSCAANGSGFNGSANVPVNGNESKIAQAAWIDNPSTCTWTAVGPNGTSSITEVLETGSGFLPTLKVTRNPTPLIAGRPFTTTWSTSKATALSYNCQASGNGLKASGILSLNGSEEKTAMSEWIGSPSLCTWTVTGPAGVREIKETLTTIDGSLMTVTLDTNVKHIRVPKGETASISLNGYAIYPMGEVTKLELLQNNRNGTISIKTITGNESKLTFNYVASFSAGSYQLKLRATNQNGTTIDSAPVVINVIDSPLLGEVSGIRSNNMGKLDLHGWACQVSNSEGLRYKVTVDVPSVLGGAEIASGIAGISNESNQSQVSEICQTPNAGHHFVVNLAPLANAFSGRRLFVEVSTWNQLISTTLPCADNNCTMPGAIRIGLTTPQNNDRYTGPAIVFMRAKIDNGNGIYDELAFNINGEWINATPDSEPGTYTAMKTGVPSRATPYPVVAKVRQGNATIYSAENLIYIDAINSGVRVSVTSPVDNQSAPLGNPITLRASASLLQGSTAQIGTVKFSVNGTLLGNATNAGNGNWTVAWTPSQLGIANVKAIAFDNAGNSLQESAVVRVNITANSDLIPASSTPIPINITPPYLSNPDAGSLPGSLGVDKNGSANYSIPIGLPPGTAGMVPSLSLNYSSDNTTGSAGLGWSLGGISNIDRCGKTVAVDGVADAVRFETTVRVSPYNLQPTDRLCLDGQRLILVNGDANDNFAYWANGAEYRTEVESFNKITAIIANGKRAFKVENKAGQIIYYGNTSDSYITAIGRDVIPVGGDPNLAHRWRISQSVDRSGNSINYYYQNDGTTGESKPSSIRWGGNISGQSHYAKVDFTYESRPDAREAYIAGARNDENLRLKGITTKTDTGTDGSGGVIANQYKLTFELSPSSGRSLLKTIQICDASDNCLPATTFNWGTPDPSATKGFVELGSERIGPNLAAFGQNIKLLNDAVSLSAAISPMSTIITGDFNNDGKTDLLERYRLGANSNQQALYTTNTDGNAWIKTTPFAHLPGHLTVIETGDFDADGLLDVLVADQILGSASISNWRICFGKFNTADRFECNQAINFPSDAFAGSWNYPNPARLVKDFNADGKDDIFLRSGPITSNYDDRNNVAYTCLSTGNGFNCTKVAGPGMIDITNVIDLGEADIGAISTGNVYSDVDGDGRVDQLSLGKCVRQQSQSGLYEWYCGSAGRNGNIKTTAQVEPGANRVSGNWFSFPDRQTTVLPPPSTGTLTGDFSADGYSDMVFGTVKLTANGGYVDSFGSHICLSKGNGFASCKNLPFSNFVNGTNLDHLVLSVNDYDGDGIQDVLRPANNLWLEHNINGYRMCRIGPSGSFHRCENWSGPQFKTLSFTLLADGASDDAIFDRDRTMFFGDFDGDGKQDIVAYYGDKNRSDQSKWQIYKAADQAKSGEALDKLISVTNGLGLEERVQYAKSNDSSTIQASAALPNGQEAVKGKRSVPHRQVVKTLSKSTGNGYWLDTNYTYAGYAVDGQGRGSLGFAKVTSYNVQSNISSTTWYSQEFPHIGTPLYQQTMRGQGGMGPNWYLSESTSTPAMVTYPQQNGKVTYLPYISTSTVTKRDLDSSMMGTTVSTTSPPDSYGNSSDNTVTTSNGGEQFVTTQSFIHTHNVWPLSQLDKVTESKRVGNVTAPSHTVDYTYDANGLVQTETKQKGNPQYEIKTTYDRSGNNFGLVNKTLISYRDPVVGDVTKVMSEVSYTSNGRFPSMVKNALGHYETKVFDARNGAPVSNTDINGLTTTWQVDGFGRKLKQRTPDGTDIYTYQKRCVNECPNGAVSVLINDTRRGTVRVAVPSLVFSDSAGHPIRSITWGFDGTLIGSQITYDSQGRVYENYQPRFIGHMVNDDVASGAPLVVRNYYDDLNRVTQTDVLDEAGLKSNITSYRGLVTEIKNVKNQIKTDTKDVWGRLIQSVDANSGITQYEHDPYNNLTKTTDPKFNVVQIGYDDMGRRIKLSDPDLGIHDYVLNPLGQVIKQTSPVQRRKSAETGVDHSTTLKYDDLGRMVERNEYDLKGRWVYDNQAGQNCRYKYSCGKLVETYTLNGTIKDNVQSHAYDYYSRPSRTIYERDISYTVYFLYDQWGRRISEQHQRGNDIPKMFDYRYNAYGYQYQILRSTYNSRQVLWQANEQDASQRIRQTALGNFLRTERNYYATTGRLQSATLMSNTGTQQLFENYSYDALGNVSERSQQWAADSTGNPVNGFIELFSYDGLNRLATASVTGYATQVFNYDSIGNIENKTGVGNGNYVYPTSGATSFGTYGASNNRPHAVQSIPGIGSFTYDDNGNLKNGAGRTVDWTSFDMPSSISKGNESSTFVYGADHQRTKQIKSDGGANTSTIYYAGAMEIETKGGSVESIKTYWPGGIGFETDKPNQTTELNWIHTDRLGSIIAISNAGGTLVERLAYDSWGKRRSLSGNETPDSIDGVKDNKGFTGHEMLDKLDLVHMNGRIYDPLIARFMSADPIIQDPMHSQSYNRYTYVWNNPTNLTDPTGFETVKVTMTWDDPKTVCDEKCQKEQAQSAANCAEKQKDCDKLLDGTYKVENKEKGVTNTIELSGGDFTLVKYRHLAPVFVGAGKSVLKGIWEIGVLTAAKLDPLFPFSSLAQDVSRRLSPSNESEVVGFFVGTVASFMGTGLPGSIQGVVKKGANSAVVNNGLRTSTVVSAERAKAFLVKNGMSSDRAADFVASFDGSITARLVRPGEDFLRYTDVLDSTGSFVTKTSFPNPAAAVDGLYLTPYGNNASLVQSVTSTGRSIMLEGGVANGTVGVQQSIIINRGVFNFGIGVKY